MLTWEGQKFSGPQNIVGKFKSLPFQQVQHQVTAMDFQPSMSGGILIQVNGKLMVCLAAITVRLLNVLYANLLELYLLAHCIIFNLLSWQTDGENHPLQFSQTFHLMPVNNSFIVTNGTNHCWLPLYDNMAAQITLARAEHFCAHSSLELEADGTVGILCGCLRTCRNFQALLRLKHARMCSWADAETRLMQLGDNGCNVLKHTMHSFCHPEMHVSKFDLS